MADVFKRRCGCGLLLALRESCVRCASAARARLHEAGIATMRGQEHCSHPEEQWHRNTDTCGLCGIALRKVRMAIMQKRWEAQRCAHPKLQPRGQRKVDGECPDCEGEVVWFRDDTSFTLGRSARRDKAKHESPAVGAEVSWTEAERDMRARPEARYQHTAANGTGQYRIDGGQLKSCRSAYECCASFSGGYEFTGTWVRLEDASATTLPAIGAEVAWSEAKADMQRRKEARYDYRQPGAVGEAEYMWHGGVLLFRARGGMWQESSFSEAAAGNPLLRWVRLA